MSYDDLPPFLRVEQAMELLQLGRSQLYALTNRWLETGGKEGIPVVKFGRCLRIPTAAVLRNGAHPAGPGRRHRCRLRS